MARLPVSSRRSTLPASDQQGGTLLPWPTGWLHVRMLHDNVETPKSDSTTNEPTAHHDGIKHGAFHASRNPCGFPSRSLPKEVKLRRRSRREGAEKGLTTSDDQAHAPAFWTSRR